jgi:hypothetical protein
MTMVSPVRAIGRILNLVMHAQSGTSTSSAFVTLGNQGKLRKAAVGQVTLRVHVLP